MILENKYLMSAWKILMNWQIWKHWSAWSQWVCPKCALFMKGFPSPVESPRELLTLANASTQAIQSEAGGRRAWRFYVSPTHWTHSYSNRQPWMETTGIAPATWDIPWNTRVLKGRISIKDCHPQAPLPSAICHIKESGSPTTKIPI